MSELFDMRDRLKWMDKHGIWTQRIAAECTPTERQWKAITNGVTAFGQTEDCAVVSLAKALNIKLWNEPLTK